MVCVHAQKSTFDPCSLTDKTPPLSPQLHLVLSRSIDEDKFFENSLAQLGDLESDDIWGTVSASSGTHLKKIFLRARRGR